MADQLRIIEGAACEQCGGCLVASDGRISCGDCGRVAGLVTLADRTKEHHDAIAGEIVITTTSRRSGKRQTKAQRALDRLNNASLFDPVIRPRSDNRNGFRSSGTNWSALPTKPLRVRLGKTRCVPCDRLLVVRTNKVICPSCGVIVADIGMLNLLRDELGAVPIE